MLGHLLDEFGCEFDPHDELLHVKGSVIELDFVSVNGVLRERSETLEKLMKFCQENKRQVRDRVVVVVHPSDRAAALSSIHQ